jgi:hypothetical protein
MILAKLGWITAELNTYIFLIFMSYLPLLFATNRFLF